MSQRISRLVIRYSTSCYREQMVHTDAEGIAMLLTRSHDISMNVCNLVPLHSWRLPTPMGARRLYWKTTELASR